MKKILTYILDFFKGLILGFVCVATPGVSGGTIAVVINVFNKIIENGDKLFHNVFKKEWWKTILFFVVLAVGGVIGAFVGSKVVSITYDKYPLAVTLLLIGFIVGSFATLFKNVKAGIKKPSNIITFVVVFGLALAYTFLLSKSSANPLEDMNIWKYIALVFMGIITVATMIIPGISGNIFLMSFGYYYPLVNIISNIGSMDKSYTLPIVGAFLVGCILGAVLIIKLLKFLLDKFAMKTNVAIFGFVVASPIIMVKLCILDNESFVFNSTELIIGIILCLVGFAVSFLLGYLSNKREEKQVEQIEK